IRTISNSKPIHIPHYRLHKATGQAVVTLNGKDHYLGKHGSTASKEAYERLITEWLAHHRQLPCPKGGLVISQVILAFLRHAQDYYRKPDGKPTSEIHCLRAALRPLRELFGSLPADEFGPAQLRAVREEMIRKGWVRTSINLHICRIRSLFRWAMEHSMI